MPLVEALLGDPGEYWASLNQTGKPEFAILSDPFGGDLSWRFSPAGGIDAQREKLPRYLMSAHGRSRAGRPAIPEIVCCGESP
ncbi:MAG: hypothetical protein WBW93_13000 [Steroidobacteraceae bacterium]